MKMRLKAEHPCVLCFVHPKTALLRCLARSFIFAVLCGTIPTPYPVMSFGDDKQPSLCRTFHELRSCGPMEKGNNRKGCRNRKNRLQSWEMPRKACLDLFFMSSSHKSLPSAKTTRTLMVNTCHFRGNAPVLRTIPGGFFVQWLQWSAVVCFFSLSVETSFVVLCVAPFERLFQFCGWKAKQNKKKHLQEGQTTSTHVITHSSVHNGTHGYDSSPRKI